MLLKLDTGEVEIGGEMLAISVVLLIVGSQWIVAKKRGNLGYIKIVLKLPVG